jgi:nitroimidazol reductase NimA-like FMN-containing flavoprotein (pyridoxamine 5'-phosphate oxidase superfamily)
MEDVPIKQSAVPEPRFRDLSKKEIETFLAKHHVGRIAFSFHDLVDVRPIHYVYSDGWMFGRTSHGDKLVTLRHHQWVAFEVDEVAGPLDWKSVVAHGTFYRLHPEGSASDIRLYERGLRLIRSFAPEALTDRDPVTFRTELFGIAVDSMSGRSSSTKPRKRRSGNVTNKTR